LDPITIDDSIFSWKSGKSETITEPVIGNFRNRERDAEFEKKLEELIEAINVDLADDAPTSFL
jgi:hypothetical protein